MHERLVYKNLAAKCIQNLQHKLNVMYKTCNEWNVQKVLWGFNNIVRLSRAINVWGRLNIDEGTVKSWGSSFGVV